MRWAAADLGTNTFRLLVAEETAPGRLRQVELAQRVVRLGQGVDRTGALAPEALARAEACLADFAARMDRHGAERRVGALTATGRTAADGGSFRARAERILGATLTIPDGEEEAALSYLGCRSLLPARPEPDVVFLDIGGGSTEAVFHAGGGEPEMMSLPAGVVSLTEAAAPADPPTPADLDRLSARVAEALAPFAGAAVRGGWPERFARGSAIFLATAGTPLTVAAHLSGRGVTDTRALNGTRVTAADLDALFGAWSGLGCAARAQLPAIAPGREDVILAGLLFLREALRRAGAAGFAVGDGGVLEGVLLDTVRRFRGTARWEG